MSSKWLEARHNLATAVQSDNVKLALPKGRLLPATALLLKETELEFEDYTQGTRSYRLKSTRLPHLSSKIFQEKDIPVQVAVGNYDLGICGLDWVEELVAKYPSSAILKIVDLGYGSGNLYLAASRYGKILRLQDLSDRLYSWRMVTEYPNLAELAALNLRLRRFKIFPVWGAAEAYPPENADLALLWAKDEPQIETQSLIPLKTLVSSSACLIANRESWQSKNVSRIISYFSRALEMKDKPWLKMKMQSAKSSNNFRPDAGEEKIWLALPDGHQQPPTAELLNKARLEVQGYSEDKLSRRPVFNLDWIKAKVIRPQDMPLQVANGNFDLAITGQDWLFDHLCRFPSSPVEELLALGFGQVRVVAVTSHDFHLADIGQLKRAQDSRATPIRVASEYINIADKYLRDNHVSRYQLIPTWGASEAFLPEDADLLIENTQTGKTLARHNLRIVDTILQSTACLIGNKESLGASLKKKKIASLVKIFSQAVDDN
jgi:ATP phosphoribosyltransferase